MFVGEGQQMFSINAVDEVDEWDFHSKNGIEKGSVSSQGLDAPRRVHDCHIDRIFEFDWIAIDTTVDDGADGLPFYLSNVVLQDFHRG